MMARWLATALFAISFSTAIGCEGAGGDYGGSDSDGDTDTDTDGDTDVDSDTDTDTDTDTESTGPTGTIQGIVYAPSGTFPISGALVYVTAGNAEVIEDNAYCYECDDMTGKKWTLSGPDGTWILEGVPSGERNLVTRKGFFQRQRQITVVGDTVQDIPAEITTLPAASTGDGLDTIPNYAVLLN